ncbi:hypothetical protein DP939_37435 [Spongiactinospora rosea]|uniref:Uncharacterized protein n=2 Tax=Spongiactinospora rosea TaxID=2248750 RepID=A0A366LMP8_9ACTN|nr:hypothetical protein DP939_37435 [Spongiactinospora rosea]
MKRKRTTSDRTEAVHHPPATSHPGTPVHLNGNKRRRLAGDFVPHVTVREGTITHMEFGPGRTPSPFGKEMGDHTTAWASVVDALHASLHGKTVKDSVEELRKRQSHAEAWKSDDNSTGKKLWKILASSSDPDRRDGLLKESARKVGELLDQAEDALNDSEPPDKAAGLLAEAIGRHLTYDNLLPYATVRAKSQTGSKGSGEGTARTAVLKVERNPDAPFSATGTRDNLWKLFSMEAAVREANIERVVAPNWRKGISKDIKNTRDLTDKVSGFIQSGDWPTFAKEAKTIITDAKKLAAHKRPYSALHDMTTQIIQTVGALQDLLVDTRRMSPRVLKKHADDLAEGRKAVDSLEEMLTGDPNALNDGALILAHLLYRHQTTVATAYPNAVAKSDFLTADAAEAAATRLREYLKADPQNDEAEIEQLVTRVQALHATFQPRPKVGDGSGWAASAGTGNLVITFSGKDLVIQGRAAAPDGVEGHGSHTTAWMTEVDAVHGMLATAGKAGIAAELGTQTTKALNGEPMTKLAALLPADQLNAGQLPAIFDAATSVLAAGSPEESIKAYLTFRNLLPYATVDAGDRGGHGERRGAKATTLFDAESLQAAIEQKELEPEDVREAAMRNAHDVLTASLPRWDDPVRQAAGTTATKLTEPIDTALAKTIMRVRRTEHRRIYNLGRQQPPSTK